MKLCKTGHYTIQNPNKKAKNTKHSGPSKQKIADFWNALMQTTEGKTKADNITEYNKCAPYMYIH
jgi:hypothetical protein